VDLRLQKPKAHDDEFEVQKPKAHDDEFEIHPAYDPAQPEDKVSFLDSRRPPALDYQARTWSPPTLLKCASLVTSVSSTAADFGLSRKSIPALEEAAGGILPCILTGDLANECPATLTMSTVRAWETATGPLTLEPELGFGVATPASV
jgi:hypothetical protein